MGRLIMKRTHKGIRTKMRIGKKTDGSGRGVECTSACHVRNEWRGKGVEEGMGRGKWGNKGGPWYKNERDDCRAGDEN